jgi:hypothetical protein
VADSVVTEQVIFQSINEIRQLFPGADAIKTITKQGYVWLPNVVIKEKFKPTKTNAKKALFALCALVVVLESYSLFKPLNDASNEAQQNLSGSIVILPTQNLIEGNDHSWIRLGMMDQVIQRLSNSQHRSILQTDYVFDVIKRAGAPLNNLLTAHIQQIFMVSGAELIVSSKLSGKPHDYQLSYVLHYRNRLKKGVLFNRKIQSLIDEFSLLIATKLGDELLPLEVAYQADFNNELLGAAIEKRLEGNYKLANSMLENIVLSNPENLTAQRLLADNLFRLRLFEQVAQRIERALPIAQRLKDKDELAYLLYLKSLLQDVTGKGLIAEGIAVQVLATAKENNDWLLMAYIKDVQATIAFHNSNYVLAEALTYEAKQHHQVLRCPAGEAQAWARLAWLAKQQNQPEKFTVAINQAIKIAKARDLTSQLDDFTQTKKQGFNQ